jgi:hypothetical protein
MARTHINRFYVELKEKIEQLETALKKNKSLSDYFCRNHLFTLQKIVLKKIKQQRKKLNSFLDNELRFVNSEIVRRKKNLEKLSICRIKIASRIDPEIASMYLKRHRQGRF